MPRKPTNACKLDVTWDTASNPRRVRGPVFRLVDLPEGAEGEHGRITRFTPEYGRLHMELVSPCATMSRPRQSGHEIEGRVKIRGKAYSAFTDGEAQAIIIRDRRKATFPIRQLGRSKRR